MDQEELTWMMLREKLAQPDDIFSEEVFGDDGKSAFTPMGDAVKSLLAAAQEDGGEFRFEDFVGGLKDPAERQQYFATLAGAAGSTKDPAIRNRIYEAAKQYQTANLGEFNEQDRPRAQHAMHQMLLNAMANKGPVVGGQPPPSPTPGATPVPSLGSTLTDLEARKEAEREAWQALGYE